MNVEHPRSKLIRCSQCKYLDLDSHICFFLDDVESNIVCEMFKKEYGEEGSDSDFVKYCKLHGDTIWNMMNQWWKEDIEHECEVFEAKEQSDGKD